MVEPVNGIPVICAWEPCSKPFVVFPSRLKQSTKIYCSRACGNLGNAVAAESKKRRVTLTCAYEPCSKSFEAKPSVAKRGMRYCSHGCSELASRHRRTEYTSLICAYEPCSKPFEVAPSRLKEATYCCRQCQTFAIAAIRWPQTLEERFWSKVAIAGPDECWLWTASVHENGYGQFQVRENGVLLHDGAHVASFFLHHGRWPAPEMQVLHTCDVRACCNPAHLWEGTQTANMVDCVDKGRNVNVTHPELLARGDRSGLRVHRERAPRGERNANWKISDAEWAEALALWDSGAWTQTALAKRYGVSQHAIWSRLKHRYDP